MPIFEMAALLIAIVFAGGLLLYLHRTVAARSACVIFIFPSPKVLLSTPR